MSLRKKKKGHLSPGRQQHGSTDTPAAAERMVVATLNYGVVVKLPQQQQESLRKVFQSTSSHRGMPTARDRSHMLESIMHAMQPVDEHMNEDQVCYIWPISETQSGF